MKNFTLWFILFEFHISFFFVFFVDKNFIMSKPIHNLKSVKKVLDALLKSYGIDTKIKNYQVLENFSEIVGENIAKHAKAERIESGKLFLSVTSGVWRQELSFRKEEMIKKINNYYRQEIVKDIIFR